MVARRANRPKIDQLSDGLWVVFDQPKGSTLWLAKFSSWRDAARAWVYEHRRK